MTGESLPPAGDSETTNTDVEGRIELTKSADPTRVDTVGQTVTYTFVATNIGDISVNGVTISDPLPRLSALECPTDRSLDPGQWLTCTATYSINQADLDAGSILNTATAFATDAQGHTIEPVSADEVVGVASEPALTITKTASEQTVRSVGDVINYTFEVTNTGNVTINDVSVADDVAGVALSGCTRASLAPTDSFTCSGSYTVTQDDLDSLDIVNTATASGTASGGGSVSSDPAESHVGVESAPSMTMVKTPNRTSVDAAGDIIEYTFTFTNTGNVTLSDVRVTDDLPGISAVTCPDPAVVAPGDEIECTASYAVSQGLFDTGAIPNRATATATAPGDDPDTSTDDVTTTATATVSADQDGAISLTKTADREEVSARGEIVTYTFVVVNEGDVTLSDIGIRDPMAGMSTIRCDATTLAPGAQTSCVGTYPVTLTDMDAGTFTNTATVTGRYPNGVTTVSDDASETVGVNEQPRLEISKTADTLSAVLPGQVIRYTFIGHNAGNVSAHIVGITDPMPGLSALDCSPTTPATLPPGSDIVCTATLTVTQDHLDSGAITNTATITGEDPHGDPIEPASADDVIDVSVTRGLSLEKRADLTVVENAGEVIAYTLVARNTGNQRLHDVTVTDPMLPDLECTPAAPATLNPNEGMVCTADYTVTQTDMDAGIVDNVATVTGTAPDGTALDPVTGGAVVEATAEPELELAKVANPDVVANAGTVLTYSFTITNNGNLTAHGLAISDEMPGLVWQDCPALADPLAPDASITCTATYEMTQADVDAGGVTNVASVTGTDPFDNPIPADTAEETVTSPHTPDVTLTITPDRTSVSAPGEVIRYTVRVQNSGNTTLTNLTVVDPSGRLGTLVCPTPMPDPEDHVIDTLAPGEFVDCYVEYVVTQDDIDAGQVPNSAEVTADSPGEQPGDPQVQVEDTDTAVVDVVDQTIDLELVKSTVTTEITSVGQQVPYTFVLTNNGTVSLDVTLTDPLPGLSALDCDSTGRMAPGAMRTCTAIDTVTQDDLDAGSLTNTATASPVTVPGVELPPVTSTVIVPVTAEPVLSLTKIVGLEDVGDSNEKADPGDVLHYTLVARNEGSVSVTNVVVDDPLAGLSPLSCTRELPTTLRPGEDVYCEATYTVTAADARRGSVTNTAVVTSDSLGESVAATATVPAIAETRPSDPGGGRPTLPNTGAPLTWPFLLASLLLVPSGMLLIRRGRRQDSHG